jgi:hypothetical protein
MTGEIPFQVAQHAIHVHYVPAKSSKTARLPVSQCFAVRQEDTEWG